MKVAVISPFSPPLQQKIREAAAGCEVTFFDRPLTAQEIGQYHIIVGNPAHALLPQATNLKLLQLISAGTDGYTDRAVYPGDNVVLCNASGAYGDVIAEFMLAMQLCLQKNLHLYRDNMVHPAWEMLPAGAGAAGATVLCLGTGDIGGHYAQKVQALGGYTIGVKNTPAAELPGFDELHTTGELDALLPRADVIAMSLPDTPATRGLMGADQLARCKPGALLINVGRGTAVDTEALLQALRSGRLGGAALDVTDPEPLPADHPLWRQPGCLITPHVTGRSNDQVTKKAIAEIAAANIASFLQSGKPVRAVDFKKTY